MKKSGKLLDTLKGTGSVKASADAALQAMSALEELPEEEVIELVGCAKKTAVEDWGVEDHDIETPGLCASLPIGGHLSLISEEDISRKANRKGPKTWSDVKETFMENRHGDDVNTSSGKNPHESSSPAEPALYRPPRIKAASKVDVTSHTVFPDLECLQPKSTATQPVPVSATSCSLSKKKTQKDKNTKNVQVTPPLSQEATKGVMLMEEFLKDIKVPLIQVPPYDDDACRNKFIGRKKKPPQEIPASEYDVLV